MSTSDLVRRLTVANTGQWMMNYPKGGHAACNMTVTEQSYHAVLSAALVIFFMQAVTV